MPGLIWAPSARRDLTTINDYVGENDAGTALDTLRAIRKAANRLTDYPRIGRAMNPQFRVLGVRATQYLIVYRIRNDGVEIVRVRHRRENWTYDIEAEF